MQNITAHSLAMFCHLLGFLLVGGVSIGGLMIEGQFWKYVEQSSVKAIAFREMLIFYPTLIRAASIISLVSGAWLLWHNEWIYLSSLWITAKIILYVLLMLNGILVADKVGGRIIQNLENYDGNTSEVQRLKIQMKWFYYFQNLMFALLISMSVFKF